MGTKVMRGHQHPLQLPFVWQLLVIMFVTEYVKGALLVSILPLYMESALGMSAFVIGLAFSLQYIGDNLFRSPLGWLVDRVGYRYTMVFGLLITFGAVVLMAVTSHGAWIVVGCALLGVGTSPLWPCVVSGVTEVAGEGAKASILSTVHIAWLSGVGLGPITMNVFTEQGFALPFRVMIIVMGAITLLAFFLPTRVDQGEEKSASQSADKRSSRWIDLAAMRRYFQEVRSSISVSRWFFPALFLQTFALGLLTPVVTLYARNVLDLSGIQYSLFMLLGGGITVLLLFPIGRLVDRHGGAWFLHIGFAMAGASLVLFPQFQSLSVLYTLAAGLGLSYALIIPAWNYLIASAVPEEKRGAVWGFYLTINGSGMVTGPIVSGWLWERYSPGMPFVVSGSVLILLLIVHILISNEKRVVVR